MTLAANTYELLPKRNTFATLNDLADLAVRSLTPNPFYHPAVLSAAIEHLSTQVTRLTVIRENGQPVAALPTQNRQGFPLYSRAFTHIYNYLHSPLYLNTESLRMCILESLAHSTFGTLLLPTISLSDQFQLDLLEALQGTGSSIIYFNKYERAGYLASLETNPAELSKSQQKKLAKKRSALNENSTVTELEVDNHQTFAEHFLELEELGWKGRSGSALASSKSGQNFFFSIIRNELFRPHLLCSKLSSNDTNLALSCTFTIGASAFRFKTTYNENYKRYSPGAVLEIDILKSLASKGSSIDGCCSPQAENMNRLYPHKIKVASAFIISNKGIRGKFLSPLILHAFKTQAKDASFAL